MLQGRKGLYPGGQYISLGNIKRRKGKILFLALGLIIGISTIVTLLGITETMTAEIEERLNKFGANIVMVPKTENLSLNYGGTDVGGVSYEVREFSQENENQVLLGASVASILGVSPGDEMMMENRPLIVSGVLFDP